VQVETFIVFRASTPLAISIAEWWFLGRELPNARSLTCLVVLLFSAVGCAEVAPSAALGSIHRTIHRTIHRAFTPPPHPPGTHRGSLRTLIV
jgi:hypothetical protein